jgi:hypothetical protein
VSTTLCWVRIHLLCPSQEEFLAYDKIFFIYSVQVLQSNSLRVFIPSVKRVCTPIWYLDTP